MLLYYILSSWRRKTKQTFAFGPMLIFPVTVGSNQSVEQLVSQSY